MNLQWRLFSKWTGIKKQTGQGLVEYALILVLVAIVVIAVLALVGPAISNVFSNIIQHLNMNAYP